MEMKLYDIFDKIGIFILILSLWSLLSSRVMISLALMFTGYAILGINMMIRNTVTGWG